MPKMAELSLFTKGVKKWMPVTERSVIVKVISVKSLTPSFLSRYLFDNWKIVSSISKIFWATVLGNLITFRPSSISTAKPILMFKYFF